MSRTLSRVLVIGHLGRDPDMRYLPDGRASARFSLATDRSGKPGAQVETDWHTVVCWEQLAEFAYEYLSRGRLVFVGGRLVYRAFEGRDGRQHRVAEIVASEIIPLDRRPESSGASAGADLSSGGDASLAPEATAPTEPHADGATA